MKTIYNVYVPMESQEQCDRMKQICIDYNLNDTIHPTDFEFGNTYKFLLWAVSGFFIASHIYSNTKVTEQEFIELLKNTKLC